MNKKGLLLILGGIAALIVSLGLKCGTGPPKTPVIVYAPESTWFKATTPIKVFTTAPKNKDIRYVADLGQSDGKMDTSDVLPSGDTVYIYPKWTQLGNFKFKVAAFLDENQAKISEFSKEKSIRVLPNSPPESIWIYAPSVLAKDVWEYFYVSAVDPEGDSITFYFDFGDGKKEWVDTLIASGETLTYAHKYTKVGNFWLKVKARDKKRTESEPESIQVTVGTAGKVKWWFVNNAEEELPPVASPVVAIPGDTWIYTYCGDGRFYAVNYSQGKTRASAIALDTFRDFCGHPAYCASQRHILIGEEGGYLHSLRVEDLARVWYWNTPETTDLSTPAINGSYIYIASGKDTLYWLIDQGSTCVESAAYKLPAGLEAPVIDRSGNVLCALDNGILYKMPPDLQNPVWECTLNLGVSLLPPIIGDNGMIYVADDSGYVYAVREDGSKAWTALGNAGDIGGMVLGTRLFVTTSSGKLIALSPENGSKVYDKKVHLIRTPNLIGSPLLATNGYIYFMDDDEILYAAQQSTGDVIWSANCLEQVEGGVRCHHPRRLAELMEPSLTIGPSGNIIVVGSSYMYCVLGETDKVLDEAAPWPKWQKDLFNTGKK
ncbi:MAG: PQQ-binding-like beta-propeller repeat protein [candidate division WOR-3 bacterium]